MNDELQELRTKLGKIQTSIYEIEDKRRAEQNTALMGECFRYRNCYSCPKSESDKWWMYQRVTAVSKTGRLTVFRFEVDKDGQFTSVETTTSAGNLGDSITLKQFKHAWKVTARMLNDRARKAGAYQP